jgi:hypothetical protein
MRDLCLSNRCSRPACGERSFPTLSAVRGGEGARRDLAGHTSLATRGPIAPPNAVLAIPEHESPGARSRDSYSCDCRLSRASDRVSPRGLRRSAISSREVDRAPCDYMALRSSSPFSSPPIPNKLGPVSIIRLEQGSAERLGQARIVETDAQIVLGTFAIRPCRPGVADT